MRGGPKTTARGLAAPITDSYARPWYQQSITQYHDVVPANPHSVPGRSTSGRCGRAKRPVHGGRRTQRHAPLC
eukprot:1128162-Rhodomonas_salina.6